MARRPLPVDGGKTPESKLAYLWLGSLRQDTSACVKAGGVVQGSLDQPPMAVKARRGRGVLPLAIGLPLLLLGAVMWTGGATGSASGVVLFLVGFACVTAGLLALAVPPELTIGPEGATLKGALHTRTYRWEQVCNFRLIQVRRTQLIGFDRPGGQTLMRDVASALRTVSVSGPYDAGLPGSWDLPVEEVIAALNDGRARWGGLAAARAPPPRPRGATGQRIDRRVYWTAAGILLAIGVVLAMLGHGARWISGGLSLMWIWVIARRLHDIGRSGWWQAAAYGAEVALGIGMVAAQASLPLVTGVLGIAHLGLLATLGVIPGTRGDNRFGPPPGQLEPQVQAEVFS